MPVQFLSAADRASLSQFPTTISEQEIITYFTLTQDDLQQVNRQRLPHNRLGFALQLGCLRFMGFCPDELLSVPTTVIEFLSQQLDTSPEVLVEYGQRAQTRTEHLRQIQNHLGFRTLTPIDLEALKEWLVARALEHDKPSLLFQLAAQRLYRHRIVRPAVTTMERAIAAARSQAAIATFETLQNLLTPENRQFLDGLLLLDEGLGDLPLSWLRRSATTNSPTAILQTLEKLCFLRNRGIHRWDISALNPNRLKLLAQLGKRTPAPSLRRAADERKYPILVAFVCRLVQQLSDEVGDLFVNCLAETYARARHDWESFRLQEATAFDEKILLLHRMGQIVLDPEIGDEQVRPGIFEQIPPEQLADILDDCLRLMRPTHDHYYDFLANRYSYIRRFAPALFATLNFDGSDNQAMLLRAISLIHQLNQSRQRTLPETAPTEFVTPTWLSYVRDSSGNLSRRYYELCVLWELRRALRAGHIWIEGSRRYANPSSYLIPKHLWPHLRSEICQLVQIPDDGKRRLEQLQQQLQVEIELFERTLEGQTTARMDNEQLVVSPLQSEPISAVAHFLKHKLNKRLPEIDLTDLLIEIDRFTGFSRCFEHAGGKTVHSPQTRIYLYAAILAQACNLGLKRMAQVASLPYEQLVWTTNWYLREETLQPAIDAIVNFQYHQPLSRIWGGGTLSSSDGQRFPVSVRNSQAVALPRYFGYGRGITFYTWTSDQFSQYGDKVIPSTMRDATYVLDGILDNQTELNVLEHTTDTAGYTDLVFALFDLLGLRFSPRIRDLADQRLFVTESMTVPQYLDCLEPDLVNSSAFLSQWDDMLRAAASLKFGWVTASLFIGKLRGFAQQNSLLKGLTEYGRLVKTLFVLRYLNQPDYRRRISSQLNKGESLHSLRRFILFARLGELRHRHQEELANQSSCLTLVTNAIVAWNTLYMHKAIEQLRQQGTPIDDEDILHVSPARFEHINPYGKLDFDLAKNLNLDGLRPLRQS